VPVLTSQRSMPQLTLASAGSAEPWRVEGAIAAGGVVVPGRSLLSIAATPPLAAAMSAPRTRATRERFLGVALLMVVTALRRVVAAPCSGPEQAHRARPSTDRIAGRSRQRPGCGVRPYSPRELEAQ